MKQWLFAAGMALALSAQAASPEWVAAKVMTVDPARSRVTLAHERIPSIDMDAMTMPFKVRKGIDLKRFKPGDKVRFQVANKDDHLTIEAMEKAK